MNALLLALALCGQSHSYDLIGVAKARPAIYSTPKSDAKPHAYSAANGELHLWPVDVDDEPKAVTLARAQDAEEMLQAEELFMARRDIAKLKAYIRAKGVAGCFCSIIDDPCSCSPDACPCSACPVHVRKAATPRPSAQAVVTSTPPPVAVQAPPVVYETQPAFRVRAAIQPVRQVYSYAPAQVLARPFYFPGSAYGYSQGAACYGGNCPR